MISIHTHIPMRRMAFSSLAALGLYCFATPTYAQQLQAAGISAGFNIARLKADRYAFRYNSILIDPLADQSNDETGNSITLFGRWKIGQTGWYLQPELGYMSALETPILLSNASSAFPILIAASGALMPDCWEAINLGRCACLRALASVTISIIREILLPRIRNYRLL